MRRSKRLPPDIALCPRCGEPLPVFGPCSHCAYDPAAFAWATPQGGARMEGDFVRGVIRLVRETMRRWHR